MSPRLPVVTGLDCIRALQRGSFLIEHQRGSHVRLRHPEHHGLRVTVPSTRHDLPPKTLQRVLRQANLSLEDFIALI